MKNVIPKTHEENISRTLRFNGLYGKIQKSPVQEEYEPLELEKHSGFHAGALV